MAYIKNIRFAHVGRNEGCLCDRCGTYIQNIVTVDYTDGISLNYGQECFSKLYNSGKLSQYGIKLMKKTLKSIEKYSKQFEEYKTGEITADNADIYQFDQTYGGYWKDKPFEEYRQWMIDVWFPLRFKECQKEIDRFKKVNFDR